jgi:hypothetical protein
VAQTKLPVFEPKDRAEVVEGWALHATRRRKTHEEQSRRLDRWHYVLGTIGAALVAAVGTSAFAGWQTHTRSIAAAVVTAAVGVAAAILANTLTFLNLGARAEAHRRAATAYKKVLREFEGTIGSRQADGEKLSDGDLTSLKALLDDADGGAPIVPETLGHDVDTQPFWFAPTADELAPNERKGSTPAG